MCQHLFVTGPARSGTSLMLMLMHYIKRCKVYDQHEYDPLRLQEVERIAKEMKTEDARHYATKQPFGFWEEWGEYNFQYLFDHGAKIICMMRDPRDVAVSHNPHSPGERYFWRDYSWIRTAQEILKHKDSHTHDLLVVKYEDLVTDTLTQMHRVASFVGEALLPGYEKFYEHPSVNAKFSNDVSAKRLRGKRVWATLGGWHTKKAARPISADRIGLWKAEEHQEHLKTAITDQVRNLAQRLGYNIAEE